MGLFGKQRCYHLRIELILQLRFDLLKRRQINVSYYRYYEQRLDRQCTEFGLKTFRSYLVINQIYHLLTIY
jgi:hypothetical protein